MLTYKRRKGSGSGFTLVEIMISIAILSVGILGTMSAIAYGVRTTRIGQDSTQGMEISRRILEIMLEGGSARGVLGGAAGSYGWNSTNGVPPTSTQYNANWKPLVADPTTNPITLQAPFDLDDFIDTGDPAQVKAFSETADKYEYNIVRCKYTSDTTKAESNLYNVTVEVRWTDKGRTATSGHGNKSVKASGIFRQS